MKRREFLYGLGGLAFLAGCRRENPQPAPTRTLAPASPSPVESEGYEFIVRNRRPNDLETPVEVFENFLTPNERFFVRSHHPEPTVDEAAWTLTVRHPGREALKMDLSTLKKDFEPATVTAVLQCAGNSRGFYKPTVPGVQWGRGAAGNAEWRGARLADVLKRAGVDEKSPTNVVFEGADKPLMDTVPRFVRQLPLSKCLHPDTLLAYQMNGDPLPRLHGGPVRVVVPGWVGDDWLKWVTSITLQKEETQGFYYQKGYRYPANPGPPGDAAAAKDMQPMTELATRSLFARPSDGQKVSSGETLTLKGVAWTGGDKLIDKVEVSGDGGKSWMEARLEGEALPYAWRVWNVSWKPEQAGVVTLLCRATDSSGFQQSLEDPPWNPGGYLWNSADRIQVEVTA